MAREDWEEPLKERNPRPGDGWLPTTAAGCYIPKEALWNGLGSSGPVFVSHACFS